MITNVCCLKPLSFGVTCYTAGAAAAKSLQSCPILCDPMDRSPPGSSVHGIFQARTLEWGAIAFSIYALVYYIGVFLSGLLHSV